MTTVTITLRDADRDFIAAAVESGRYVTESEAIADALAELRAREELHQARLSEFSQKVTVGLDQLERGEGLEWDLQKVREKGRALLASRQAGA